MPVDRLLLDFNRFQALSSRTRVRILKSLDRRQMTLSELSGDLDLAKSTLHEHLSHLVETGFVAPKNDGHRWIYYALTPDGVALLHQNEKIRVTILLNSVIIAFFVAVCAVLWCLYCQTLQKDLAYYRDGVQDWEPLLFGVFCLFIVWILGFFVFRYIRSK